jgi:hypothetical protein
MLTRVERRLSQAGQHLDRECMSTCSLSMNDDYLFDGSGGHLGPWGRRRDGQIGEREDMSATSADCFLRLPWLCAWHGCLFDKSRAGRRSLVKVRMGSFRLVEAVMLVWRLAGAVR